MFALPNIRKYFILAALICAAGFATWKYYTYTQNQIQVAKTNAALAEQALADSNDTLSMVREDLIQVREEFDRVSQEFADAQRRVDVLEEKLTEHELGALAQAKPALVEKIVDNATQDVLRCFEIESGSPLTQEEINATRPSEINTSCPDIANPNYRP